MNDGTATAGDAGRYTYSSASERRDRLERLVGELGYSSVAELSERFGVSEMTIRRDIARLVDQGRLRAFHGGVGALSPGYLSGVDYRDRDQQMPSAKAAIAATAAELVSPGQVIGLDSGTTASQLAARLPAQSDLRVITPSLPAVTALANQPGTELTCLGGVLHSESLSFAGSATLAAIGNLQVDIFFLSASALNERGAYCGNSFDAVTKQAMLDVSTRVVLLADSSKFGARSMVRVCGWDNIDELVVDDGIGAAERQLLDRAGVELRLARVPSPAGARG